VACTCESFITPLFIFGEEWEHTVGNITIVVWYLQVVPNITYQCMDQKLSKVPDDIPSSTKNIDLSFNPLKILKSYSFSNFSELQWLDLSR
jgi:hypothetical protein